MEETKLKWEPSHHRRYRQAWDEYRTNTDAGRAKELEREMDAAQNYFAPREFHVFKLTLPGFVEYWSFLTTDGLRRAAGQDWQRR
jgi:hypothetical protein